MSSASSEADWRNVSSRSYYAAYHLCLNVAHHHSITIPPYTSGHVALVEALGKLANPVIVRSLSYMLNQCRNDRRKADYDI